MNIYDGLLQFKGTWRSYQERVLKHADAYLKNEKMHIVAPPGSGKTTLGIELIRRLGIESKTRVEADEDGQAWYQIYLKGGTVREKEVFSNCVEEFFGVIDNQRYLLYNKHAGIGMSKYYCVPKLFAKSREEAQLFALYMKKSIGKSDIIYTRNPEGRKILLKARARSFANLSDRQLKRLNGQRHVRVKGALE